MPRNFSVYSRFFANSNFIFGPWLTGAGEFLVFDSNWNLGQWNLKLGSRSLWYRAIWENIQYIIYNNLFKIIYVSQNWHKRKIFKFQTNCCYDFMHSNSNKFLQIICLYLIIMPLVVENGLKFSNVAVSNDITWVSIILMFHVYSGFNNNQLNLCWDHSRRIL